MDDAPLFPTEVSLRGPLPDPHHEAFAHGFVAYGANATLAYAHAYGVTPLEVSVAEVRALANAPHIAARIRQLKEQSEDILVLTKVSLAMEYADIRELAKATADYNAAIKAQDRIAQLAGQIEDERKKNESAQTTAPLFVINMPPPAQTLQDWMHAQGIAAPVIQKPVIDMPALTDE